MDTTALDGYLALPATGAGPGVLVLHPWWGLSAAVKDMCDRLAAAGFVASAPDLYHGRLAATVEEAEALAQELDQRADEVMSEISAAADKLWQRARPGSGGLGVVGLSLGAYYALRLADSDPDHIRAVVLYYGTGYQAAGRSRAAYLGHFAAQDSFEPLEAVAAQATALRAAGRTAAFYDYPNTGHWFAEPDRPEAYNAQAAALAWERTVAFLLQQLQR